MKAQRVSVKAMYNGYKRVSTNLVAYSTCIIKKEVGSHRVPNVDDWIL